MPPSTQRPSVMASAAGPSHGSITELSRIHVAMGLRHGLRCLHASGTISDLAIGGVAPGAHQHLETASSAAESEPPAWITGLMSSMCSPKISAAMRVSWLFIQLMLPRSVLISPLWARMRNGWASGQVGKVLVE